MKQLTLKQPAFFQLKPSITKKISEQNDISKFKDLETCMAEQKKLCKKEGRYGKRGYDQPYATGLFQTILSIVFK